MGPRSCRAAGAGGGGVGAALLGRGSSARLPCDPGRGPSAKGSGYSQYAAPQLAGAAARRAGRKLSTVGAQEGAQGRRPRLARCRTPGIGSHPLSRSLRLPRGRPPGSALGTLRCRAPQPRGPIRQGRGRGAGARQGQRERATRPRRVILAGTPSPRGAATPNTPSLSPPGTEDGVLGGESPQLEHRGGGASAPGDGQARASGGGQASGRAVRGRAGQRAGRCGGAESQCVGRCGGGQASAPGGVRGAAGRTAWCGRAPGRGDDAPRRSCRKAVDQTATSRCPETPGQFSETWPVMWRSRPTRRGSR